MKQIIITTMVLCSLLTSAGLSWAMMANGTDGGRLDTWVASTDYSIKNMGEITRLGEIGGGTQVSESDTLLLLGCGLVCLGFFGRKKLKK